LIHAVSACNELDQISGIEFLIALEIAFGPGRVPFDTVFIVTGLKQAHQIRRVELVIRIHISQHDAAQSRHDPSALLIEAAAEVIEGVELVLDILDRGGIPNSNILRPSPPTKNRTSRGNYGLCHEF
jgi:hypothetical protein